jgi:hypothetical protein
MASFSRSRLPYSCALLIVWFIAVGSAACFAQSRPLPGGAILDCSGLPCIDLQVSDGHHLKMLIDTGNVNSVLDLSKAQELGVSLTSIVGPDGKASPDYSIGMLTGAQAGDASLGDLNVLVMNLEPEITKGAMPKADGTIAYTAFRDRLLQLDYRTRKYGISAILKDRTPCSKCGQMTYPTFGKKGPPIVVVNGFNVKGKHVTVQIDTLYSGTMLIYSASVAKLNFSPDPASKKRFFPFTDDGVEMIEGSTAPQGFGGKVLMKNAPIYFTTPGVHEPDGMFDGTVGDELFRGHVLTLDFYQNQFSIS